MSKLNAGIGEAMYAVKKWLGVNESPDGDTNLRNGEGAVMRNFRITDGGALRKRPGSAIVAGLVNSYTISIGEEKLARKELNRSEFSTKAYSGVNASETGEIVFTGEAANVLSLGSSEASAGLYYPGSDPTKAWQHSRVEVAEAEGMKRGDGGAVDFGAGRDEFFAFGARYTGQPEDCPSLYELVGYSGFSVDKGTITLTGAAKYTDHSALQEAAGGSNLNSPINPNEKYLYYIHTDGKPYRIEVDNYIVNSANERVGLIMRGYPISAVYDDSYSWYANEVSNTANTADTVVRGLWSGFVGGREYIVAACSGHLWSLTDNDGEWSKTDIGVIDTTDHVCLFGFDTKLYVMDGKEYYVWDGASFGTVEGYIPLVGVASSPAGATTTLERINLLTAKRRQQFSADGTATVYQLVEKGLASIDRVTVDGAEVSGQTVDADKGTVSFATAPAAGTNNVEIWYTAKEAYRDRVTAMRYAEFYNGQNDSRVFLYGDGSNITRYSDTRYDTTKASAEYFPDLNEIAIGDGNTPITALIRQYSRLMVFKAGGSAWSIYYDTVTLADGSVTAGFYCNGVNRSIGNDALGQAVLVENKPRTVDGRSIYEWQSSSGGYVTNDQRNAQRVSQKVESTLLGFDLADSVMFFDKINHEFYCVHKGVAIVQNTENEAWYIYTNFPAVAMIVHKDELYFGTDMGDLRRFSDDYTSDAGAEIDAYWESGSMSFDRDYMLKYSPSVWVGLKQEDNAAITVGIETDANELITETIELSGSGDAMPRMNRRRLKAQKFTYYKLVFASKSAEKRATVMAADIRVKYNIKVK